MIVLGLTGPSGSGKSTVADQFRLLGIPVIDADEVYHKLLIPPSPCLDGIAAAFGSRILHPDGTLHRRALAEIVFSDSDRLSELNRITHAGVMQKVREQLEELRRLQTPISVFDAPQLFEAGADADCDAVIAVLADRDLRLQRIMQRDKIGYEDAMLRLRAQKDDAFYRSRCRFVLENNREAGELLPQIREILDAMGGGRT